MKSFIFSEVIIEAEYISVDPYLRYMARQIPLNTVMTGTAVCRYDPPLILNYCTKRKLIFTFILFFFFFP